MLAFLRVRDFALIDDLALPLHPGLTVLTGETGAGKTIIVDALQAALGERVDAAMVRTGSETAAVEAGFSGADGEENVVRRELAREGKGRCFIGGDLAPLSRLKALGDALVDLAGQHEHQTLLRPAAQLLLLDAFAGCGQERMELASAVREWKEVAGRVRDAEERGRERASRADYLRFVAREIAEAAPREGEDEALLREERVLAQAERILGAVAGAIEGLEGEEGAAAARLGRVSTLLREAGAVDARLREMQELVDSAKAQAQEAARMLSSYADRISADPARLEEVATRLARLGSLKKKHGPTLADVIAAGEKASGELARLTGEEEGLDALKAREKELAAATAGAAAELTAKRRKAAARLEKKVKNELAELAMAKTRFAVSFAASPLSESGADAVEFLLAPNPGEPLLPLSRIASGGELSRVMLAVKAVQAGEDSVPTLVFDEVDAGIGGETARVLGRKIRAIAEGRQVLCITHLAPVAAGAAHHLLVEKVEEKGRTVIRARYLEREERVAEIARMMGGASVTRKMLDSAREMMEAARA
jgi:DNA repair protein RecN (Recombination protein N)